MSTRKLTLTLAIAAANLLTVSAQTPAAPKGQQAPSTVPRLANGKPDLTGIWQPGSTRRGTWEEANSGTGLGGTGVDPRAPVATSSTERQGREAAPYQPWAAQKVLESFNKRAIDDPTALCLPPGVPRVASVGLFPLQIMQSPQQMILLYEYMNTFRVINMNTKHPDDLEPSYLGDSVGHWEGDTLVVDITNFNDRTWLIGVGTFHSEALHVTERYTRVDKDRIDYDVIMEDSKVLTKPWPYHNTFMLREGTRLREYICPENNLDPAHYEKLLKDGVKLSR